MTRIEYVTTALICAVLTLVAYCIFILWVWQAPAPPPSHSDLMFCDTGNKDAMIGRFCVAVVGLFVTGIGGWGGADLVKWVVDNPHGKV